MRPSPLTARALADPLLSRLKTPVPSPQVPPRRPATNGARSAHGRTSPAVALRWMDGWAMRWAGGGSYRAGAPDRTPRFARLARRAPSTSCCLLQPHPAPARVRVVGCWHGRKRDDVPPVCLGAVATLPLPWRGFRGSQGMPTPASLVLQKGYCVQYYNEFGASAFSPGVGGKKIRELQS